MPQDQVHLIIPLDSIGRLPSGASFNKKEGRANVKASLGKQDGKDVIYIDASCDSLQVLCLYYEEQNKKLTKQNAELSNTIRTEKEQCSNPVKVAIFSFIVGLVSGIIITIKTRKKMDKNFMYGIAAVKFGEKTIGYIEKGSWDWGGTKPESTDIDAEQVPDAPVLTILTKNATISPTFNIIQLNYENIQAVLGGTLVGTTGKYTGWKAPTNLVQLSGKWTIDFVSGQTCTIPNATILANLGGKLTLTEVSKLECQLKVNKPSDGSAPYDINDTANPSRTSSTSQANSVKV